MAEFIARNNQSYYLEKKFDVGMVENATIGVGKYISRRLGF